MRRGAVRAGAPTFQAGQRYGRSAPGWPVKRERPPCAASVGSREEGGGWRGEKRRQGRSALGGFVAC